MAIANETINYIITDASKITITNSTGTLVDGEYRVKLTYGTDNKVIEPDAGFLVKFGPILHQKVEGTITEAYDYVLVPKTYFTVKLPLYRAGEGTCVAIATGDTITLTPTLSEEVVYYKEACEDLGLTFSYTTE